MWEGITYWTKKIKDHMKNKRNDALTSAFNTISLLSKAREQVEYFKEHDIPKYTELGSKRWAFFDWMEVVLSEIQEEIELMDISIVKDYNRLSKVECNIGRIEICEIIKALSLTNRINLDGKPIKQVDLIKLFELTLNIDISKNFHKHLDEAKKKFKRSVDEESYLLELHKLYLDDLNTRKSKD